MLARESAHARQLGDRVKKWLIADRVAGGLDDANEV
jgi:hypothetical protein